tara:strand:+ start:190 stop:726 length:537 start_codon:yes stop_codon:yes gene_type:complete
MANNRCFDSHYSIKTASERSREQKHKSIFKEFQCNIEIADISNANPTKTNGYKYNQNFIVNHNCDISNGHVDYNRSYELKAAIKNGADLIIKPTQVATPKYQSWCGNLYSVDYSNNSVHSVLTTDASFTNIVVDPSYQVFYDGCSIGYNALNQPETWTQVVDLSFQTSFYAKSANNSL